MKCDDKSKEGGKPFEPESPKVIVCEGFHEMGLVCALLNHLQITNCDVTYPKRSDGVMGKEAIQKLVALLAGRASSLTGVLIVADADGDPAASFRETIKAFVDPFKPPTSSFTIHKGKRHNTGIYLTPGNGKTGELEHLLLEAVSSENPNALTCIDEFRACTATMADWSDNKVAKMRMACYVATHCKNDPCCSLAYLWARKNRISELQA